MIPASKTNVEETKTSNTCGLLCISIVNPPKHATIILKYNRGAPNNYWCTEDMLVLPNINDNSNGSKVQLQNIATMNAEKTGSIPLSISLSIHAKKAHIFDGL